MIKSVIIDDEQANLDLLSRMLGKYCPDIAIAGHAMSAEEGYRLIKETNPALVFLDIKMPVKNGFDMLRMFNQINFNVVFVSGFNEYAIQAFEFSAVDYILKPIDYEKLINAVAKVKGRVEAEEYHHVLHFIHSLDEKSQLIKRISLHHNDRVHVIDINDICYVQALRGYSEIITYGGQKLVSSKTLCDYEDLLHPFSNFLRVNKSMIINIHHVKEYTKGSECLITLRNCDEEIEVSRRKKSSILQQLKDKFSFPAGTPTRLNAEIS